MRDRTRRPAAALPVPAVVWVISTGDSARGRRVDDRLRGPLVVLPPAGRPALVLADRIWSEARSKWRMLRDAILTIVVVAAVLPSFCSPRSISCRFAFVSSGRPRALLLLLTE